MQQHIKTTTSGSTYERERSMREGTDFCLKFNSDGERPLSLNLGGGRGVAGGPEALPVIFLVQMSE